MRKNVRLNLTEKEKIAQTISGLESGNVNFNLANTDDIET
jgi:hypothetical protein